MYRKHFGLTQHPFSNEVEPEDLFPAAAAKELETRLAHLLEMRGIGLVTGDAGSGKTCGARRVLAQLHSSLYRVVYVCLSTGNVLDLYKTISWEMGLPVERSRAALFRQIRGEVTRLVSEARCRPVLVIDEAHDLRPDVVALRTHWHRWLHIGWHAEAEMGVPFRCARRKRERNEPAQEPADHPAVSQRARA